MNLNFTKKILLSLSFVMVYSFSISNLMACITTTTPGTTYTPLDVRNTIKDVSNCNGCTYLLVLKDDDYADPTAYSPGWDGALIDVSINEGAITQHKVTTQQNDCALIPLCVTDGGFIDLEYWNGAFEAEHGFTLYTADGNIATDINGNLVDYSGYPPVGTLIRVKADCPAPICDGSTLDLELIPSLGGNNEPLFYEIQDAAGNILFSEGPLTSDNLEGGTVTLNKCETYTIVFGSSAGVGASAIWDGARMSVIASEDAYNTRGPVMDQNYMFRLIRPTLGSNGMVMREFTIPCEPEEVAPISLLTDFNSCEYTGTLDLPLLEPEVCYNTCHVDCGSPAVSAEVFLNGTSIATYGYDYGVGIVYAPGPIAGPFPAGKHELNYVFTYNCEAVGNRNPADRVQVQRSADLLISSEANPTMACNPLVNVTLGHDDEDCETLITADMVLEDLDLCSEEEYEIVIDGTGGNYVTSAQACTEVKYTITHCYSGATCWGYLNIEDKTAPTIACFDYDLPCNHPYADDLDYSATESFCTANSVVTKEGIKVSAGFVADYCAPQGEIIQSICLNLDLDHTRHGDLRVFLNTPYGTINLPRANNAPFCSTDEDSPLAALIGLPYTNGAWTLELLDTNPVNNPNDNPDRGIGYGKLLEACIDIDHGFPNPVEAYDCTLQYVTLLNEQLVETNCDQSNWNGAKIVRTYQAVDKPGNASTCVQTVNLKAPSIADLDFPGDIHIECDGTPAEDLDLADSGTFAFGCFDLDDTHHNLCDVSFTYSDQVLPVCGDSYKILRDWTIINWCSNVTKHHTQTIFVEDTTGPELPTGDITIDATGYDCEGSVTLSDFGITDGCSGVSSVIATYTNADGQLNIVELVGGGLLEGLAYGSNSVEITATDGCFQTTTTTINIEVEDRTNPVAICDDDLHISLNSNGSARLFAEDFDEGSSDNCELTNIEIRSLGCVGGSFDAYADFACCDLGTVRVELRVTDANGNTNICWADLLVEDPVAPIVVCKPDLTLTCDEPGYANAFTEPDALDNCAVSLLSIEDGGELDNCHVGTLTRTWTYTDGSDKSNDQSCTQRITVEHVSDFTIQFPQDITITNCPDEIGATGEPLILDDECELVSITHEDQVLTLVDDACYKIIRKWTVTNWCINPTGAGTDLGIPLPLPNTYRDDDGYFYYEQVIKVLDDEAPTVAISVGDPCDYTDGCQGEATITATGSDACSGVVDLVYHYVIDLNSDGTYDITGNGDDASGLYPYGDHTIEFTVSDGCGNGVVETATFSVLDCKNPTPVCKHGLAIEVMNDGDGCAPIWANDFLEYAFDNCTADNIVESSVLIRREGETGPPTSSLEICCSDVPAGTVGIEVWVTDEAGNSDFCVSYIIAQDNLGNCPDAGTGTATLSGDIVTEDYEDVEQVMVDVNYGSGSTPTGSNGTYVFPNLQVGNTFMVDPAKDINPLNGVSTYDLVLISQHILGVNPLTSPYQLIAADVNNSGSVSTFDIVQLRQLILFVVSDLPNNESWRFVDMDYVFPVPTNPWAEAFPEEILINGLPANGEYLADFFAIKIGDINGTAIPNNLLGSEDRSANESIFMAIEDRTIEAGETFELAFKAADFKNILGYQFTLDFDQNAVEFVQTEAGKINTTDSNFGLTLLEEGVITTSFSQSAAMNVENDETLFSLSFVAKQNTSISAVFDLNNRFTVAEAYDETGEQLDLALKFTSKAGAITVDGAEFDLYQNQPNPFKETTSIAFNLPKASKVSLRIHDVAGKTVKMIEGEYNKGRNEILISKNELNATGVLFYTLETEDDSATKKMIIID